MKYNISVKAAEDLENIWLYTVEKWSLEQADRYLDLIFDEIEYLAQHPNTGKDAGHIRESYRYSRVKAHLIFYRNAGTQHTIEVIRILHQRMDITDRLGE